MLYRKIISHIITIYQLISQLNKLVKVSYQPGGCLPWRFDAILPSVEACSNCTGAGGVDTNWDEHHDGGVVVRGGQFPLSANALSGQHMH